MLRPCADACQRVSPRRLMLQNVVGNRHQLSRSVSGLSWYLAGVDTQKPNSPLNPYEPPNPYQAPASVEAPVTPSESLRKIGLNYRYVILSLLAGIVLWAVQNAVSANNEPSLAPVRFVLVVLGWIINVFSLVFAVRLAHALYGVATAVICGLLMAGSAYYSGLLVLIILAILSSGATRRLRAAGIRVGFLGPRVS